MLIAGWKACSLIDVFGSVSFALWTCGCNLKCPFCHNWRIAEADESICKEVSVDKIVREIEASAYLVDYLHVSGGEPLIQYLEVKKLFSETSGFVKTSLNSNLTLPNQLADVIDTVDHVATDVKIPKIMYGVDNWREMYERFLASIKVIGDSDIVLELRVPLLKAGLSDYISVIDSVLSRVSKVYVVINRIICDMAVTPRNIIWCREHMLSNTEFTSLASKLASYLNERGVKTFLSPGTYYLNGVVHGNRESKRRGA